MKKKNIKEYFIIGMENIIGLEDDVNLIAIKPLKTLTGSMKSAMMATFECNLDVDEIKEILNVGGKRNFFISEMNPATFSAHIDNEDVDTYMFAEFHKKQEIFVDVRRKFKNFISTGITKNSISEIDVEFDEENLTSLSESQRSALMDELLTNDVEKLTDNQKKVLSFLASL